MAWVPPSRRPADNYNEFGTNECFILRTGKDGCRQVHKLNTIRKEGSVTTHKIVNKLNRRKVAPPLLLPLGHANLACYISGVCHKHSSDPILSRKESKKDSESTAKAFRAACRPPSGPNIMVGTSIIPTRDMNIAQIKYTNRYLETQAEILGHTTIHAIKGSFKGS